MTVLPELGIKFYTEEKERQRSSQPRKKKSNT